MKLINNVLNATLIIYFILTLLYCLPNNPIKIYNSNYLKIFDIFLQQRWDFFAPPPKSNYKLYFSYFDRKKALIGTYEVLTPILNEKRNSLPFNASAEALDYIISGNISEIIYLIANNQKEIAYKNRNKKTQSNYVNVHKTLNEDIFSNCYFKTIKNFSKIIRKGNISNKDAVHYVQISIVEVEIKKFIDRYSNERESKNLVIKSDLLKYD